MEDEEFPPDTTHGCLRINGVGVFDSSWVFGTESNICTCGALPEGEPWDKMTFHALDCSSIPCPMCSLEPQPRGGGTTTRSTDG